MEAKMSWDPEIMGDLKFELGKIFCLDDIVKGYV